MTTITRDASIVVVDAVLACLSTISTSDPDTDRHSLVLGTEVLGDTSAMRLTEVEDAGKVVWLYGDRSNNGDVVIFVGQRITPLTDTTTAPKFAGKYSFKSGQYYDAAKFIHDVFSS